MADLSGPLTAGRIIEPATVTPVDLAAAGYAEQEFAVSGTAAAYEPGADAGTAPFRTRVVVRRPADPGRFSGTLVVEWLNVSGGLEADPDWAYLHEEIFRQGHAYAAVSAQALGVVGGRSLLGFPGPPSPGLRGSDPARYGTLEHPGDRYAFDIFSQAGQALAGSDALGGPRPERLLAVGESQSAFYLTSYINAVHPQAGVFDGFFVHSRGASAAPLDGTGLAGEVLTPSEGTPIQPASGTPVLVQQAEGDLLPPLASWLARQPDSEWFRLWEVAGTAHADSYLIGPTAALLGCDWRINEGPQRLVAQAALSALERWVRDGTPPPEAARIGLAAENPTRIARDRHGIAEGGVRTPDVDVPVCVLSGEAPPGVKGPGWLVGSTTPLEPAEMVRLYGDADGYLTAFRRSADEAIDAGFLLPAHRDELMARAQTQSGLIGP
jgi:Alpha/beta hydrolase domain